MNTLDDWQRIGIAYRLATEHWFLHLERVGRSHFTYECSDWDIYRSVIL